MPNHTTSHRTAAYNTTSWAKLSLSLSLSQTRTRDESSRSLSLSLSLSLCGANNQRIHSQRRRAHSAVRQARGHPVDTGSGGVAEAWSCGQSEKYPIYMAKSVQMRVTCQCITREDR